MQTENVDLFVGVDLTFNFPEGRLRKAGIATAHYVSPSVYARAEGALRKWRDVPTCYFACTHLNRNFMQGCRCVRCSLDTRWRKLSTWMVAVVMHVSAPCAVASCTDDPVIAVLPGSA